MCPYDTEIENIKKQIISRYNPIDIIIFGSCAKGRVSKSSDIDLCIIMNTKNKREVVCDMLLNIEYNVDLDIVVYTPEEWEYYKNDKTTFAGIINRGGVSLIG